MQNNLKFEREGHTSTGQAWCVSVPCVKAAQLRSAVCQASILRRSYYIKELLCKTLLPPTCFKRGQVVLVHFLKENMTVEMQTSPEMSPSKRDLLTRDHRHASLRGEHRSARPFCISPESGLNHGVWEGTVGYMGLAEQDLPGFLWLNSPFIWTRATQCWFSEVQKYLQLTYLSRSKGAVTA